MPFRNRKQAGERLAEALRPWEKEAPVVIALPRGGVDVALPVALRLKAPMTVMLVRKIGLPHQPEVAMGAIADSDSPITIRNAAVIAMAGVSAAIFDAVAERELAEIRRRRELYLAGRDTIDIRGRAVIVVDDGIATGATVRAAIRGLRACGPSRVVLAVPVASQEAIALLGGDVDEIVVLEELDARGAVGFSYEDFPQLSDADVMAALDAASRALREGEG